MSILTVFASSSLEGLPIAEGLQRALDGVAVATVWHKGVLTLAEGTLKAFDGLVDASRGSVMA